MGRSEWLQVLLFLFRGARRSSFVQQCTSDTRVSGELIRWQVFDAMYFVTFWLAGCRNNNSPETGRPGRPRHTFQVQNSRKPARCQEMTVSGLTMASAERQMRDSQTHNRRSPEVNFGRFLADLRSTPIWCRRAKFSSWRVARERKSEDRVASGGVRNAH